MRRSFGRWRFHDLRHTYGSVRAAHGVDAVTIQAANEPLPAHVAREPAGGDVHEGARIKTRA